jgi:hypothetical protein
MSIQEQQPNPSVETSSRQPYKLESLYSKLISEAPQRGDIKSFRTTVGRDLFEINNVKGCICKGLFGQQSQRDIVTTVTRLGLVIHMINVGGKFTDEKASLGLYSDESHDRSYLYVADGKHGNNTKMKAKNIDIKPEDYFSITKVVEAIAAGKGLIKK